MAGPSFPGIGNTGPRKVAPASPLSKLLGNKDFIISIECYANHVTVTPSGLQYRWNMGNTADNDRGLVQTVTNLIANGSVGAPGEPPYRPIIRFHVASDGLRTYYRAVDLLQAFRAFPRRAKTWRIEKSPKTRYSASLEFSEIGVYVSPQAAAEKRIDPFQLRFVPRSGDQCGRYHHPPDPGHLGRRLRSYHASMQWLDLEPIPEVQTPKITDDPLNARLKQSQAELDDAKTRLLEQLKDLELAAGKTRTREDRLRDLSKLRGDLEAEVKELIAKDARATARSIK